MNLYDLFENNALRNSVKTAVIFKNEALTYGELKDRITKTAAAMHEAGLRKGDTICLYMYNSIEFVVIYLAAASIGLINVPVNTLLKGEELYYIMNNCMAKGIAVSFPLLKTVREISSRLKSLEHIWVTGDIPEDFATEGNETRFNDLWKSSGDINNAMSQFSDSRPREEDRCIFLYTSGTTGFPKGAVLSHSNVVSNIKATIETVKCRENDIFICVLPMFHTFAATFCMLIPLAAGSTIIVMDQFTPSGVLKTISERKATIFAGVPTMYTYLTMVEDLSPYDLSQLRMCVSGGAPLPVEIITRFKEKYGLEIVEGYGLSETSPVVSINPVDGVKKNGSIGVPISGVSVKVVDDEDNDLPVNEVGEILVKGPNVMEGYFMMPEATEQALRNGWLHTGDLGRIDEDGYIYIVDRKKDMIIVGGLNVYPREIEEILYSHPKIAEAAVIGIPDMLRGEAIKAVVVLKQGEAATQREIISYCNDHLANYKVPDKVEFVESLPKSGSGKILKRLIPR